MPTVALDAMGSDHGALATVAGAAQLSLEAGAPQILLVGHEATLQSALRTCEHARARIDIVHAPDAIGPHESAREAIGNRPGASVCVAAECVRSGAADAFVSAGNTGAVTLALAQALGRVPGVRRCALGAVYPTELRHGDRGDPFSLILDVGLTLEASAEELVTFAAMGAAYARLISDNARPRVALLSNGTERHKGPPAVVEAHAMLVDRDRGYEFLGNIEGIDIPRGTADVIVTSGFVGNVVLKMLEGVAETVTRLGRYAMQEKLRYRLGATLLAPAVKVLRQATDWQQYGGVPILGFERPCIKAHGRSGARAIRNALKVADRTARTDLTGAIAEALAGK